MRKIAAALAIALLAAPAAAQSSGSAAVDNAYRLCAAIDGTGLVSAPCEISGWSGTVTATIDMNSGEARQLCSQMVNQLRANRMLFPERQWTLHIVSPYSNGNSIAFCDLPR